MGAKGKSNPIMAQRDPAIFSPLRSRDFTEHFPLLLSQKGLCIRFMGNLVALPGARRKQRTFFFTRVELSQLLSVYASRVATGEWRDYAIDQSDDTAIFSIFRHTHEHPLFAISKTMKRGHNRPSYALFNGPQRLKTASNLSDVLSHFDKLPRLVSG